MKWISVEERLPENTDEVLACHNYEYSEPICVIAYCVKDKWFADDEGLEASNYDGGASIQLDVTITHWMPLPKPPKQ